MSERTVESAAIALRRQLWREHATPRLDRPLRRRIFDSLWTRGNPGGYRSGQTGQTVNLLANAFAGSNPAPPTKKENGPSTSDDPFFRFYDDPFATLAAVPSPSAPRLVSGSPHFVGLEKCLGHGLHDPLGVVVPFLHLLFDPQ